MKALLKAFGLFLLLQTSASMARECPEADLIMENVSAFAIAKESGSKEGTVTLDSSAWHFYSTLTTPVVDSVKSLHKEISDIDEHTCNYVIYPTDSNTEDGSLTLKALP